ncbi:hypothetical protein KEM48_009902 [Puccinia striiformis f. sp. tritici PST-130]|nr:hypothetical protein KEM48_009902 [Puccinia striiformis f. sp. tritici PST-130]
MPGSQSKTHPPIDEHRFPMTPEENQNLINHYLTLVKQQRADNPPPPPFVDPLTSDERLDGIIKNVLADQELKLDQQINFNRSLREYRANKKMEAIARRDSIYEFMIRLTSELIKDPRPTLHSQDFDAVYFKKKFDKLEKTLANDKSNPLYKVNLATFNIRFEDYRDTLIKAQEIEVQATQTRDETIIPTTKVLKIEYKPTSPVPEVTGNVHLDKHLAKTSISDKPIDKKEKTTKRKVLPLNSPFGGSTTSSFTTEPYFEDLKPTENFSSPVLKKIARKPALPILSDSEDELDEDLATPILNPSTLIQNGEPSKLDEPIKVFKTPKETTKHPGSLGIIREPLSSDESRASSEMESESEDEIPEAEIIRILIKKQVKIHAKYLKATSNEDKKVILDQAQQNQLVLQKLIPNKEIESYVNGWNPWVEKKKVFPAPPKNKKRPKSDKRNQPCQSGSNRPDRTHSNYNRDPTRSTNSRNRTHSNSNRSQGRSNNNPRQTHSNHQGNNKRHREESEDLEDEVNNSQSLQSKTLSSLSTINHNITTLEANHDVNSSKLLRVVEKCYVKTAKTLSGISDQLSDPLPVQMGPLEKSLVYHLKKEIDKDNQPLTTKQNIRLDHIARSELKSTNEAIKIKSKHTRIDRPYTNELIDLLPTTNRNQTFLTPSIDWNLKPINQTMTPLENIKLIQDTFALVKQQRLDRPPKPTPNQDHPLESSEEQIDRIVARFQLEQENELEHQIFLNRFLREFQAHKRLIKMEEVKESYRIVEKAIAALLAEIRSNPNHVNFLNFRPDAYQRKAEWLLSELKKNRANGAEEESQYLAFVQLYGDYKEELVKARKLVNTPAPEIDPGTVTPKKLEKVPAKNTRSSAKKAKPTVSPTLESTGNVLLDAHIAKKAANELKNIVPLDISDTSTVESTDSSFTTKPFELTDLFPENLKEKLSIALKKTPKGTSTPIPAKITTKTTPKAKLPVIEDSEDKLMDNDPSSIPDLTTQNPESGKEVDPLTNLFRSSAFLKKDQEEAAPQSVETTPEPQSDEEEAPDEELIKTLVKKHVKIYRTYLTTTSKKDKKDLLDRAQESQKILHKLIGNQAVQACVKGWNPWDEKKKEFPAPPKNKSKKRPRTQSSSGPSNLPFKRHQGLNADLKDPEKWKWLGRVTTILKHMLHHM